MTVTNYLSAESIKTPPLHDAANYKHFVTQQCNEWVVFTRLQRRIVIDTDGNKPVRYSTVDNSCSASQNLLNLS